jgi:hypothetical protein
MNIARTENNSKSLNLSNYAQIRCVAKFFANFKLPYKLGIITSYQGNQYKVIKYIKKGKMSWVLVVHTCNPSYLGGCDQEDGGSRPARGISSQDPPK